MSSICSPCCCCQCEKQTKPLSDQRRAESAAYSGLVLWIELQMMFPFPVKLTPQLVETENSVIGFKNRLSQILALGQTEFCSPNYPKLLSETDSLVQLVRISWGVFYPIEVKVDSARYYTTDREHFNQIQQLINDYKNRMLSLAEEVKNKISARSCVTVGSGGGGGGGGEEDKEKVIFQVYPQPSNMNQNHPAHKYQFIDPLGSSTLSSWKQNDKENTPSVLNLKLNEPNPPKEDVEVKDVDLTSLIGKTVQKYVFESVIGKGGFGITFKVKTAPVSSSFSSLTRNPHPPTTTILNESGFASNRVRFVGRRGVLLPLANQATFEQENVGMNAPPKEQRLAAKVMIQKNTKGFDAFANLLKTEEFQKEIKRKFQKDMFAFPIPSTFTHECAIQKSLDHPNVTPILDVLVETELFAGYSVMILVMPLAKMNLEQYIKQYRGQKKTLTPAVLGMSNESDDEATYFALDILNGVQYLWERQLFHMDLKPENVLLFETDQGIKAKISDFGLCCRDSIPANKVELIGTGGYRAPEIYSTKDFATLSSAVDAWSLGILLFRLITGGYHPYFDLFKFSTSSQIESTSPLLFELMYAASIDLFIERMFQTSEIMSYLASIHASSSELFQLFPTRKKFAALFNEYLKALSVQPLYTLDPEEEECSHLFFQFGLYLFRSKFLETLPQEYIQDYLLHHPIVDCLRVACRLIHPSIAKRLECIQAMKGHLQWIVKHLQESQNHSRVHHMVLRAGKQTDFEALLPSIIGCDLSTPGKINRHVQDTVFSLVYATHKKAGSVGDVVNSDIDSLCLSIFDLFFKTHQHLSSPLLPSPPLSSSSSSSSSALLASSFPGTDAQKEILRKLNDQAKMCACVSHSLKLYLREEEVSRYFQLLLEDPHYTPETKLTFYSKVLYFEKVLLSICSWKKFYE